MNNKMKSFLAPLFIFFSLFLAACATPSDNGLVAGGLIGGVAGNVVTGGSAVGTIAGAVGGALIGQDQARRNCHRCYYY